MFDIRARLSVEVEAVDAAVAQLRRITQENGGELTGDNVSLQGTVYVGSFDIRLPPQKVDGYLAAIGGLGRVLTRDVTATDITKEYSDSGILLQNLKATMHRYEELLAKATDVKDMLAIEAELSRVRGQIEHVEGERRYLEDHAARATIHVDLRQRIPEIAPSILEPEAKFYPGLRGNYFAQLGSQRNSYFGTGLSFLFGNRVTVDIDVLRRSGEGTVLDGSDLFLITAGVDTYSNLLGGGRRTFLNPYVGARTGYGRVLGQNAWVIDLELGVELMKFKYFMVDAQVAGDGLVGPSGGPTVGIQPSLTARVAF